MQPVPLLVWYPKPVHPAVDHNFIKKIYKLWFSKYRVKIAWSLKTSDSTELVAKTEKKSSWKEKREEYLFRLIGK
jgi:hypothetical protein